MNEHELLLARLQKDIAECDKHCKSANYAYAKIISYFPLTETIYNTLDIEDFASFDQFIYRYTKLQDKIGQSFIKNMAILFEGEDERRTFIDNINVLEKHQILNAVDWDNIRKLRNRLAHEYSDESSEQVELFNELTCAYKTLLDILQNIKDKLAEIKSK